MPHDATTAFHRRSYDTNDRRVLLRDVIARVNPVIELMRTCPSVRFGQLR